MLQLIICLEQSFSNWVRFVLCHMHTVPYAIVQILTYNCILLLQHDSRCVQTQQLQLSVSEKYENMNVTPYCCSITTCSVVHCHIAAP